MLLFFKLSFTKFTVDLLFMFPLLTNTNKDLNKIKKKEITVKLC